MTGLFVLRTKGQDVGELFVQSFQSRAVEGPFGYRAPSISHLALMSDSHFERLTLSREVTSLSSRQARQEGPLALRTSSFSRLQVAPASHDLIVFGDESPLVVRWRTPDGRNRPGFISTTVLEILCVPHAVSQENLHKLQPVQNTLCDLPASALNDHWPQHTFRVLWAEGQVQKECVLFKGHRDCWSQDSVTEEQVFRCELSIEKSAVLQSELESCKELQALEPENKWCLLTIILLMRALDPLVYEQGTLSYFTTLKAADPMRSAYLDDLRSKFLIENSILKMEYAESRVVDLSQRGLTLLCHLELLLLVTHMNLSDNHLRTLPPTLAMMRCLEVLEADDNWIETLEGLPPLPRLEELSLCNNRLRQPSDLLALASFPKLTSLNLQGNPLCQVPGVQAELAALLPNVATILT
ncbi:Geranylgeranyl transferase type-2 subunit alpha [Varanus komodoensis]|nr:Geranylgeranyl transferase type-2 subunit alpha [Varanus komodoensis]